MKVEEYEVRRLANFIDECIDDNGSWKHNNNVNMSRRIGKNGLEIHIDSSLEPCINLVKNVDSMGGLGKILASYPLADPTSISQFKTWLARWRYFHNHKPEKTSERSIRFNR